jgi:ppGpp synthetase/RelA/SpoT-type nucleotidyltranferase
MAKAAVPWGSKGALNRAGEALRRGQLSDEQDDIFEAWRAAHKHVLNAFQSILRNRTKGKQVVIAQRLKRRLTIIDKLHREPGMQLARMDDVAGCRLIFPTVKTLVEFRQEFQESRFKHRRRNELEKYDYIARPHPRNTGYRGIHDIYEYNASGSHADCNGLLLELQYRTREQHAWATAVEIITRVTENHPKFVRGDERYIEYFRLTSEIIARASEGLKSCYPDMPARELVERFNDLDHDIGVSALLRAITVTQMPSSAPGGNMILRFPVDGELRIHRVPPGRSPTDMYFELERVFPDDDIVLVRAETLADIRIAYRNYFSDTRAFLASVQSGCERLLQ